MPEKRPCPRGSSLAKHDPMALQLIAKLSMGAARPAPRPPSPRPWPSGVQYPPKFLGCVIMHGCTSSGCVLRQPQNLVAFVVLY